MSDMPDETNGTFKFPDIAFLNHWNDDPSGGMWMDSVSPEPFCAAEQGKYFSERKAKADKLSLLDSAYLDFCDTGNGSVEQFIRLLKQRIEAE